MKILFYSNPFFADCDFPLVKALQEAGHDVTYLIALAPYSLKSTLFEINEQLPVNAIIAATRYPELMVYKNYMDMRKVYIVNRTVKQDVSLQSLVMTLKVVQFIKSGRFDVVHTDCMLSMWNLLLYKFFGKKMVLTIHDPFPHTGEVTARKMFNYKMAMHNVRGFVLLNNKQKNAFCNTYKINPSKF